MKKNGLILLPLIGGMMLGGCDLSNINVLDLLDPLSIFHDKEVAVTSVSLSLTSKEVTVGDTFGLTATINPKDATNKKVTWSTNNASVATVSNKGVVTAKAVGTAKITVKTESGNKTATCTVTVKEQGSDPTPPTPVVDKLGPETFGDYKRVGKPDEGHNYILGFYNSGAKTMRFATGNYHSDVNGEYPYYMETTDNTVEGVATFTIEFTNDEKTHFNIKVSCPGKPWDDKYMSIYGAISSYSNPVTSLAPVSDLNEKYTTPSGDEVDVVGEFEYVESYEEVEYNTIGIYYQILGNDEQPVLRMLGCKYTDYVSIDCSEISKADDADYAVVHFFEKAE